MVPFFCVVRKNENQKSRTSFFRFQRYAKSQQVFCTWTCWLVLIQTIPGDTFIIPAVADQIVVFPLIGRVVVAAGSGIRVVLAI